MCLPVKPYKVEREWKHEGLSCAVVMNREAGHRCGYVRVPPGHSLHGVSYNEPNVKVHGGLTFSEIEPCTEHEDGQGYWFGFDCNHFGDAGMDPTVEHRGMDQRYSMGEHYWTEAEVVAETNRLAEQLA